MWTTNGSTVTIQVGEVSLVGDLVLPQSPAGVVLFAHGSGSGRHSPRNRLVAARLNERRLGTLLIDLLTEGEEAIDSRTGHLRFDIPFLAGRLESALEWLKAEKSTAEVPIGLFGASTGGAAALVAAAASPHHVRAVVSRGGRPDLAADALPRVAAPTLLIVGGYDDVVIELNRRALAQMHGPNHELVIVPGASHLFEEAGKLEDVAQLAGAWFERWLR